MQYRQKVFERLCRKGDGGAAGEAEGAGGGREVTALQASLAQASPR